MVGVGTRERQSEDEDGVSGAGDDAHVVGGAHHVHTRSLVHQGGVTQLPADGGIAVIGHGREQPAFSDDREREVQLGEAAGGRDGGAGGEEVGQHPGHDGLGVEELRRREVAQEEVHEQVQGSVCACEEGDQRVAQQGDPVDQKHPPEQRAQREPEPESPSKTSSVTAVTLPPAMSPRPDWEKEPGGSSGSTGGSWAKTEAPAATGKA